MKRLLLTLLVLISLGLCAICVVQWQREARLRGHISDLVKRLEAENAALRPRRLSLTPASAPR